MTVGAVSAHIAHEAFEEDQLCLQLLHSESQLVLTAFTLLQVLHIYSKESHKDQT